MSAKPASSSSPASPDVAAETTSPQQTAPLAVAQFAIGLLFLLTFAGFAIRSRFPVPYRDDWDWLRALLTTPLTLRTLFEPHNEHLIPLPRLLFALQYWLEGTGGVLLFCVAMATYAVIGWVFWLQIRQRWRHDRQMRRFAFGLVATCLFFTYQLQSVVFVAAILFPLVQMFAVVASAAAAAAAATSAADSHSARRRWIIAAAAMIGAALTTTNGLIVPLILALLAMVGPRRSRVWIPLIAFQALCIAGYAALVLARSNQQTALAADRWSLESLGSMVAFVLAFLGSGIVYGGTVVGLVIGAVFFAAGCYAVWTTTRDGRGSPQIERFAAALLIFTAATAAMAALGRAEFGVSQAAQSRYATFTLVYWAALIVWALSRADITASWKSRWQRTTMRAAVACTALGFVVQVIVGVVWIAKRDNLAFAGLTLAAGVDDNEWIATLHPEMHHVYEARGLLVAQGRWHFRDERIGVPLPPSTTPMCRGVMRLIRVLPGPGWRVEGTLDARDGVAVVTDNLSRIAGFAEALPMIDTPNPMQMDILAAVWRRVRDGASAEARWSGFVNVAGGPPYRLHVEDDRVGVRCHADVSPGGE